FRSGRKKTTPCLSFIVSQHTERRLPDGLRRLRQRLARAKLNHALLGPETLIPAVTRNEGAVPAILGRDQRNKRILLNSRVAERSNGHERIVLGREDQRRHVDLPCHG